MKVTLVVTFEEWLKGFFFVSGGVETELGDHTWGHRHAH